MTVLSVFSYRAQGTSLHASVVKDAILAGETILVGNMLGNQFHQAGQTGTDEKLYSGTVAMYPNETYHPKADA